jgi:REP element-mobilizing transposase RayT
MSHPREIVPGATYLITRRTLRRHLLFRPDAAIRQLLVYALAVSASRFGLQVHAFCAMSTHLHLVVTDVQGVLPRFLHFFHRIVALGTKVLRMWEGPVWDHEATSVVRLLTPGAVVQKIAYVLANPVAAGLVRHASEWPGAKVIVGDIGRGELRAIRPSVYLDPSNPQWPEEARLPIALPPTVDPEGAARFLVEVSAEIKSLEAHAHEEMHRQGHRFLDAAAVCAISPHERATSFEALRDRNPTFAVGRDQGGAVRAAAGAVSAFRRTYRAALERWCAGVRETVFPAGTWWMKAFHGASVGEVMLTG